MKSHDVVLAIRRLAKAATVLTDEDLQLAHKLCEVFKHQCRERALAFVAHAGKAPLLVTVLRTALL